MTVVSNTSPLNYLVLIGTVEILPALFEEVVAPPAVVGELSRAEAPPEVRDWISSPPSWLRMQAPARASLAIDLGAGEREAIALAQEIRADRILLDEMKARRIAISLGLQVAGTLAVLYEAHVEHLIDLPTVLADLRRTSFYLDDGLIQSILKRIGE